MIATRREKGKSGAQFRVTALARSAQLLAHASRASRCARRGRHVRGGRRAGGEAAQGSA